jgi:transcriptional regulator with XRE-family HTH domain
MSTAEILKEIRAQKGWTQEELGAKVGVTRAQICNVETGKNDLPANKLLKLLQEAGWAIVSYSL